MGKLEDGKDFRDHYEDKYDDSDVEQTHDQPAYREKTAETYEPEYFRDPESPHWEEHRPERLRDAVDRQAEHRAEAHAKYFAARLGYRYRARLSRQGQRWVPPDTSENMAPVFVRASGLQRPAADQAQDS